MRIGYSIQLKCDRADLLLSLYAVFQFQKQCSLVCMKETTDYLILLLFGSAVQPNHALGVQTVAN